MTLRTEDQRPYFVETPAGIFTASGTWYHTTEADLRQFAGPLLDRETLQGLLERADRWVRGPQTITIWVVPVLLLLMPILPAVVIATAVYILVSLFAPFLTSFRASSLLRPMEAVGVQGVLYVIAMTALARYPAIASVIAGLSAFVILRWRVLDYFLGPLLASLQRSLYRLPVPDQILRSLLLKAALVRGVTLPHFAEIEDQMIRNLARRSTRP
jgi:hypothetical protein